MTAVASRHAEGAAPQSDGVASIHNAHDNGHPIEQFMRFEEDGIH